MLKIAVSQSVFDSKEAKAVVKKAFREADEELYQLHKRGIFSEGNPNHPMYNNGINYTTGLPVSLFGYETESFMARQYK